METWPFDGRLTTADGRPFTRPQEVLKNPNLSLHIKRSLLFPKAYK